MMSDGVANDCPPLPAACLFEGWQTPERAAMAASVELLQWLSTYEHEDSDDDRTVAALWRTGAS
jgi:hypothetical protein